ncbi:MAG: HEAT repeat domain-containing protein [bacterium]
MRSKALSILRNIDDERVVPILAGVAKDDPDMRVRKRAIYYLGKSVDKRALKVLEEILEE